MIIGIAKRIGLQQSREVDSRDSVPNSRRKGSNQFRLVLILFVMNSLACQRILTTAVDEGETPSTSQSDTLKVGFITLGPVSDAGFNAAHANGRALVDLQLGEDVETTIVENIPESAEVERVMEKMISDGTKLIFPTSYGYLDPALRVADRHPDVAIMHCGGQKISGNLAAYTGFIHEAVYVSGMVAGRMTKTGRLGFVAAHPIPQVLWSVNAFTLGARSVSPNVSVMVVYTNTWSDPATEVEAAKTLISLGADVLTMHQDCPKTIVQTAEQHGVYSVGMHTDVHEFAPKWWLTGAAWDWGGFYVQVTKSVKDGTWKASSHYLGMKEGCIRLAPYGNAVPEAVRQEADLLVEAIRSGRFTVFQGPIVDQGGRQRLTEGQLPGPDWLAGMNWFVAGVEGPVKSHE